MLAIGTLTVGALPPGAAFDKLPDGITAHIAFPDSPGDAVLVADDPDDYTVHVAIFQKGDTGWQRVSLRATLRVFEDNASGATDQVSIPFESRASGPVAVSFPKESVGTGSLDVFVTFSALGGNPVPTSHHHVAKNLAIQNGEFETADRLDHHSTRVFGL